MAQVHDIEDIDLINPDAKQYFLFLCNNSVYAIDALRVVEIIEVPMITKVPLLRPSVLGVSNVRGSMIAVVDLKQRLDIEKTKLTSRSSVAILKTYQDEKEHQIAILIDEIYEVDGLNEQQFANAPLFGTNIDSNFVRHMAKYNGTDVAVLDIDTLLQIDRLAAVHQVSPDPGAVFTKIDSRSSKEWLQEDEEDFDEEVDIIKLVSTHSNDANQYLVFAGPDEQYYAKNVSKIEEIVSLRELDVVHNYDEGIVLGTANIRGEMLTLLNFDVWLGAKSAEASAYEEVMLLAYGNHKFGLVIRKTHEIVGIDPQTMHDNSNANSKSNFITKIQLEDKEVMCTIIDSDQMLTDAFSADFAVQNSSGTKQVQSNKEVLFADDSRFVRKLIAKTAQNMGLHYSLYENGQQLVDALEKKEPDEIGLVVTDVEMPKLNGKEAVAKLRAQKRYEAVAVIVYTNMANEAMRQDLLKTGADEVVNKIDMDALAQAIAKYIR